MSSEIPKRSRLRRTPVSTAMKMRLTMRALRRLTHGGVSGKSPTATKNAGGRVDFHGQVFEFDRSLTDNMLKVMFVLEAICCCFLAVASCKAFKADCKFAVCVSMSAGPSGWKYKRQDPLVWRRAKILRWRLAHQGLQNSGIRRVHRIYGQD